MKLLSLLALLAALLLWAAPSLAQAPEAPAAAGELDRKSACRERVCT